VRPDGLYEVFVIDAKGKFIKNKTVKGKKTKKGIIIIEEKTIADSAKTATEKHIEKLIKQKRISRNEAKRIFKCKFCQIDGHFEVDCRKKKSASKDNSSDKDKTAKDKETKTSKSVFFSKSSAPAAEAKEAALKELRTLTNLKSWRYLHSISDRTPSVHNKITVPTLLLKPKYDAAGGFLLWKGRLVAGGHMTDPNIYDPYEHHAPTVPLEVAKTQLGLASYAKAEIEVFDIPTAYLNAQLEDDKRHLMKFPRYLAQLLVFADATAKDFLQEDGTILLEIVRALYDLPESAKRWNSHFTSVLTSGGYVQCDSEPCLFKRGNINDTTWSIVTIYVDDCLHTYKGHGFRQIPHVDFDPDATEAPTLAIEHDMFLLQLQVIRDMKCAQVDFKSAFQNTDLQGFDIYMKPPKGLRLPDGYVLKFIEPYKARNKPLMIFTIIKLTNYSLNMAFHLTQSSPVSILSGYLTTCSYLLVSMLMIFVSLVIHKTRLIG
jgi:hypothetical protein